MGGSRSSNCPCSSLGAAPPTPQALLKGRDGVLGGCPPVLALLTVLGSTKCPLMFPPRPGAGSECWGALLGGHRASWALLGGHRASRGITGGAQSIPWCCWGGTEHPEALLGGHRASPGIAGAVGAAAGGGQLAQWGADWSKLDPHGPSPPGRRWPCDEAGGSQAPRGCPERGAPGVHSPVWGSGVAQGAGHG